MAIQAAAILTTLKAGYDAWTAFTEWREKRRVVILQRQVDELNERLRQRAGKGSRDHGRTA
jgi:hypothetical protein